MHTLNRLGLGLLILGSLMAIMAFTRLVHDHSLDKESLSLGLPVVVIVTGLVLLVIKWAPL